MNIDIEECYKKYGPMVFRRCSSLLKNEDEALDAAQDVFVSLLRHKKRLHGQFLSSLLYTIATNICLNRIRRRKLQTSHSEGSQDLHEHGSLDPQYERIEESLIMDAILLDESESTRAICFMYHGDGMTLSEIGDVMGLSVSGVRKRLLAFNTRVKLKLKGECL
jgi:RNA polymerase sigma-70 factor (ECF subfamily)